MLARPYLSALGKVPALADEPGKTPHRDLSAYLDNHVSCGFSGGALALGSRSGLCHGPLFLRCESPQFLLPLPAVDDQG
jgi:hypothetical protein